MESKQSRSKMRRTARFVLLGLLGIVGCSTFMKQLSDNLSRWSMLSQEALADPLQAVGGDGVIFEPGKEDHGLTKAQLAKATPETLVSYYAPIYVQQRVDTAAQRYPYPPEYDQIGEAHLRPEKDGKLKSYVAGDAKIYALCKQVVIEGHPHLQLTYTAWYPAHPRMKTIDLEAANVDSCVLRVTLDDEHAPLFYETIAACGCFHKVFVASRVEEAARQCYGAPENKKKYCVERVRKDAIDWEVAGIVEEAADKPRRPVVFLKAGDHKVLGMGSASRLRVPPTADTHVYTMTAYAELYDIGVDNSTKRAAFFDMEDGGKVRGAERKKEKLLFTLMGVDAAGQPRADDQIKLHFDESTWSDPTIYGKFLRLAPGTL